MANGVEDLQMLRLIKAFEKLTNQDTRRRVVRYVEQLVEKEQIDNNAKSPQGAA